MSEELAIAIATAVTAIAAVITRWIEKGRIERRHRLELDNARNGRDEDEDD